MPTDQEGHGYTGPVGQATYSFINLHGVPLIYQKPSGGQGGWLQLPDGTRVNGITNFYPKQGFFRTKDGHVVTLQQSTHPDRHGEPTTSYRLIGHTPQGLLDHNVPDTTYWSSKPGFTLATPEQLQAQARAAGTNVINVSTPTKTKTPAPSTGAPGVWTSLGGPGGRGGSGGSGGYSSFSVGGGSGKEFQADAKVSIASYGYIKALAALEPDIARLMKKYANEDLSVGAVQARLEADIRDTNWYKKHSEGQRQFEILKATDPAAYKEQLNNAKDAVMRAASRLGLTLTPAELATAATHSLADKWGDNQISQYMFSVGDVKSNGAYSTTQEGLKQVANQYLLPVSKGTLQKWSQDVLTGKITADDFTNYAKEQAKSMFPGMATAIDSGVTVAQYVAPYAEIASKTLEVPPESVNFMDPKYGKALFQTDPKTGARTSMSLADWQKTLRTDPTYGYDKTSNAKDTAAGLTQQLAQAFGNL